MDGPQEGGRYWRQVPSFNLVCPPRRAKALSPHSLLLDALLTTIVATALVLAVFLCLERSTLDSQARSAKEELGRVEARLEALEAEQKEAQDLKTATQDLRDTGQFLEQSGLQTEQARESIEALFDSKPDEVTLTSISWVQGDIEVAGLTSDFSKLVQYRSQIQSSQEIVEVSSFTSSKSEVDISFSMTLETRSSGNDGES